MRKIYIILSILVILSGCVEPTPIPGPTPEPTRIGSSTPLETPHIGKIGESVSDGNTRMTLNGFRYDQVINDIRPETGYQFVIVNITIENISPDKNLSYGDEQFGIAAGRPYSADPSASAALDRFNGSDMSPGDKRQGELAFQISKDEKDVKFRFEYLTLSSGRQARLEIFTLRS